MTSAEVLFKEPGKLWQNYTQLQLDQQLTSAKVSFPETLRVSKNKGADLGPAAIRLDAFWGGDHPYFDYWVRVHALPNIHLDNYISVNIEIDYVWNLEKNDVYNRGQKARQSIQHIAGDEALTYIGKLYLNRGTDADEIKEISGKLVFNLPLKLTWISFEHAELRKEKNTASGALKTRLNTLRFNGENTWVEIRYQGKESAYLTTLAYDKTGKQLPKKGFAKNSVSKGWLYVYSFAGEVEKIQTLFSMQAIERKYPFKIRP